MLRKIGLVLLIPLAALLFWLLMPLTEDYKDLVIILCLSLVAFSLVSLFYRGT